MKLQLLSIPLLVALLLSPLAASAATGSIAFSSPATSFAPVGSTAYTITGTITPTPTLPDNVNIQVTEQGASGVFDATNVAVGTGGTFTYSTYLAETLHGHPGRMSSRPPTLTVQPGR